MKTVHHQLVLVSDSAKDIILLPVLFSGWSVSPSRSSINHLEKWCQLLSHNHHLENAASCSRFALKCYIQRLQAKIYSINKMCVSGRVNLHWLKIFSFSNSLSSPFFHIRAFVLGDLDIHQLLSLEALGLLNRFQLTLVLKSTETNKKLAQGPRKNCTYEEGNNKER